MELKKSTSSLRAVFNDTTRGEHSAEDISFKSCESIMYRAPRETQPKIPKSALEFSTIIKDCFAFNQYFKETVVVGEGCYVFFIQKKSSECLISYATNVYFDETFKKCPKQFFQLSTLFLQFGRHVLPAIYAPLYFKSNL